MMWGDAHVKLHLQSHFMHLTKVDREAKKVKFEFLLWFIVWLHISHAHTSFAVIYLHWSSNANI